MTFPLISVVSAVYDGERYLRESLQSVLSQEGVDLELVVVDDGSRDSTPEILAEHAARDSRIQVIRQENEGLTRALRKGCAAARGGLIARHDLDDLSLPGRLARQAAMLGARADLAFVSCWARVLGPEGEVLHDQMRPREESSRVRRGEGPCGHGSVMMRRDAYEKAGGYRPQFRFGQDWDLWWRLSEIGGFAVVAEFLYAYRFDELGVSAGRRREQERFGALAEAAAEARRDGAPEAPLLAEAERLSREAAARGNRGRGAGEYFIGRSLLKRRDPAARKYLWRSVRRAPWRLRAWISLVQAALAPGRSR